MAAPMLTYVKWALLELLVLCFWRQISILKLIFDVFFKRKLATGQPLAQKSVRINLSF